MTSVFDNKPVTSLSNTTAINTFKFQQAFNPIVDGKDMYTFVVPANVKEIYCTGVAQGGSTCAGSWVSLSNSGYGGLFTGLNVISSSSIYSNAPSATATDVGFTGPTSAGYRYTNGLTALAFGSGFGQSKLGPKFLVSHGGSNENYQSQSSYSLDHGRTWTINSSANSYNSSGTNSFCRNIAVSDSGGSVAIAWGTSWNAAGSSIATMGDYGLTGAGITTTTLGLNSAYDPRQVFVRFVNGHFVVPSGATATNSFSYTTNASNPSTGWTAINVFAAAAGGTDVAWTGQNYVWGGTGGQVFTSSSISGSYTTRTTMPATNVNLVSNGKGTVIAYPGNTGYNGNTTNVKVSTDHGITWSGVAPFTSNALAGPGCIVYDDVMDNFFAFSNTTVAARTRDGSTWTTLTTNAAGVPAPIATGTAPLCIYAGNGYVNYNTVNYTGFSTATQTVAPANSVLIRAAGWPSLVPSALRGANLSVAGSVSGTLLTLYGGGKVQGTNSVGGSGYGLGVFSPGSIAVANSASGMAGGGGGGYTTAGLITQMGGPNAGNGTFHGSAPTGGGGGAIMIKDLTPTSALNFRSCGAGGGFGGSTVGSPGGGGSLYSRGGDGGYNGDAGGLGQGAPGCLSTSTYYGAGGGAEGCYRVKISVTPGEVLTLVVPQSGSKYQSSASALSNSGGAGTLFLEWNES